MKIYAIIAFSLFIATLASAQLEKNIHRTFNVDSVDQLHIKLSGDFKVEKWAGNMILAETNVKLYDAGNSVLKYFIEKGRYDLTLTKGDNKDAELASVDMRRAPIRTKNGECYEIVSVRLLVPESFSVTKDHRLIRELIEVERTPPPSNPKNRLEEPDNTEN